MLVTLIKKNKIKNITLPNKKYGIYWVTDLEPNGEEHELVSIEASDVNWKLNSNNETIIVENKLEVKNKILKEYAFYALYNKKKKQSYLLYCSPVYDESYSMYYINKKEILIGKGSDCDIIIKSNNVDDIHSKIIISDKNIELFDVSNRHGIYVNNDIVDNNLKLLSGDMIFIFGIRIIPIIEDNKIYVLINNPMKSVIVNTISFTQILQGEEENNIIIDCDEDLKLYSESDYFYKKPRFKEQIVPLNISIDSPPTKNKNNDMPLILTVGPMITSSAISLLYGYMTISNLLQRGNSLATAWPSLLVCLFSLMTTLVWPFIIRKYNKHRIKKAEKIRIKKYNEYLEEIMKTITENANIQKRVLISNSPSLTDLKKTIETKDLNLWNRKVDDEDFLYISLGLGTLPMNLDLKVPESHFSLDKDELYDSIYKMKNDVPKLENVPIVYNFFEKKITASIGEYHVNKAFVDRILFQLFTLHSYNDLKIVILSNEIRDKEKQWDFAKILPHCWNDDKTIRFYGVNKDDIREICYFLDTQLTKRLESKNDQILKKMPFYLIVTDNYRMVRNFDFIKKFLEVEKNVGFSLLIMNDKIFNLPAECNTFINVEKNVSEVFQNVLNSHVQKFVADFSTDIDIYKYSKLLSNIPMEFDNDNNSFPDKISFLELFNVGKIEQLNILNRWNDSNPMLSLQALIGIGQGGEKIYLDLHEKYHGPHGLIAGMTGSGKSEFIATYILSLAVNYHPKDVQFILVDYKGGGLAGIFENKLTGVKLPHLIGTITNLDENEINRSLASIDSEIKRRQKIFSDVREKLGESVIDIYKYQQLYKNSIITEPVSHLFIICDEFAELKSQQPEFLQRLISISRIGRSLGIHLILATQKPSGVVDNQIWSNSKFRVCLRVQEKADSSEVIQSPDAAFLKNAGRFYLQVGYNEVFVLGQSAWAGGKYVPKERVKKKIDTSVDFLNNIGFSIKKIDRSEKKSNLENYGEEITNIISHLNELAITEGIINKNLWLDKLPAYINIDALKRKYSFIKENYMLDIPIGEYDIPSHQRQSLLTVPFYSIGNVLLFGTNGSGKENFIKTLLYSAVTSYTPLEAIYYIVDYGTQSLKNFNGIPHIGDIISPDNFEKIQNLFKMLFYMIEERKNLFENFQGDYNIFSQNSEEHVPRVVVIINNYDSYSESCSMFEEQLLQLTREGPKFGIHFLISVSNYNLIKLKMRQNFQSDFVLQQNSDTDYSNILGGINRFYPSKVFGRGIIKSDSVYEFQTAMISDVKNMSNQIDKVKNILTDNTEIKAIEIPTLPKIVTKSSVQYELSNDGNVIVGIEKNDLDIIKFDLKNNYINLMLSYDVNNINSFLNPFLEQIIDMNFFNLIVINCEKFNISKDNIMYYDRNFDEIFHSLESFITKNNEIYINNNFDRKQFSLLKPKLCIIIGFDSFKSKLNEKNKSNISNLFEKGKDLEIISFILIDNIDKFKKYEFDSWYKTVVNNTRGIFFGNGLTEQMLLKINRNDRSLREEVPENFCYVINHGRPSLVKYVEKYKDDEL